MSDNSQTTKLKWTDADLYQAYIFGKRDQDAGVNYDKETLCNRVHNHQGQTHEIY